MSPAVSLPTAPRRTHPRPTPVTPFIPVVGSGTERERVLHAKTRTTTEATQRALSQDVLKVRLILALNRSVTSPVIAEWTARETSPVVLRRLLRLPNSTGSHDTILTRLAAVGNPEALANRVATARYTSDTNVIDSAAQGQDPEIVYAALINPNCPTETLLRVCYSSNSPAWKRETVKKHPNCPTEGELSLIHI